MSIATLRKRDKILEDSLFTLADSPLQETIIFQGGGALHFIYSSPRYSSDVDFVDPSIAQGVDKYMQKVQQVGEQYPINKVKIMPSGLGVRAKWGHVDGDPLSKVEIEQRAADEYNLSKSQYHILVKTPGDIYTDKIFANIARYVQRQNTNGSFPFKPNDLFDIDYIQNQLNQEPVPKSRIMERAKAYDSEHIVNNENINNIINLIHDKGNHDFFRKCIQKTMKPDVYNHMKFDDKYFSKVAEHFAQYRT